MYVQHLIYVLPTRGPGFWVVHDELEVVHDELESLQKQAIIDAAKFLAHDIAVEGVVVVAVKAVEVVAQYHGIGSIIHLLTGGGGDPPTPYKCYKYSSDGYIIALNSFMI